MNRQSPAISLPAGIPEEANYRIIIEVYKPYAKNKNGAGVPGTGLYHTVRGSAILFDAEDLGEVGILLTKIKRLMSRLDVRVREDGRRIKSKI